MEAGEASASGANMEAGKVSASVVKTRVAELPVNGASSDVTANIHDHGRVYYKGKKRVQCNYCGKVVTHFNRLKHHLAHIRGDVRPCEKNPDDVKEAFRNELLNMKKKLNVKDVGELNQSSPALTRDLSSISERVKRRKYNSNGSGDGVEVESLSKNDEGGTVLTMKRGIGSQLFVKTRENIDPLPKETQKLIGNFFYETGIDFSISKSLSFQRMINGIIGHGSLSYEMPSCQDLRGWILQDKMQEMDEYVKKIKESWTTTGCSILLDDWVDGKGRNLISFLVDCPEGPVYLRSADISSIVNDVNVQAFYSLLDGVIEEEVGFNNVIQVVACSTEGWMGAVGNRFQDRHRTLFWTVDASHCIGLILGKIGTMDSTRKILDEAKTITKFIYGHPSVLKLFQNHSPGHDLIKTFKVKSAMPFITLHNLELVQQQLKDMFSSSGWNSSTWASRVEGKRVADLVLKDYSFWTGAERVIKATIPLVHVLRLICNADKPQVGYIYEIMDQVKETIKMEFKSKKSDYMPFWELIDELWNAHLHSPLHAAGYYLNPSLYYSGGFYKDDEVLSGIFWSFIRVVPDTRSQDLIPQQMTKYSRGDGTFKDGTTTSKLYGIAPAQWWSLFGKDCPELQRCAIRVLSQTCVGASRYDLKRGMAEKLLTEGRNSVERQYLTDLTFVHYNMQLAERRSGLRNAIIEDEVDPMYDWIVDETPEFMSQNNSSIRMEPRCSGASVDNGPSSTSRVKIEPM